jgi:hypothetical protein
MGTLSGFGTPLFSHPPALWMRALLTGHGREGPGEPPSSYGEVDRSIKKGTRSRKTTLLKSLPLGMEAPRPSEEHDDTATLAPRLRPEVGHPVGSTTTDRGVEALRSLGRNRR